MNDTETQVSRLLVAVETGDAEARDQLYPLVYDELRRAAARLLSSERAGHTLNATDLVHEAWLKLGAIEEGSARQKPVADRSHMLALTVRAMRFVLVDHARRRVADKRGGGAVRVTLDERDGAQLTSPEDMLALVSALERLGEIDARLRDVVELRYFVGLTEDEIATQLSVTTRTVQRDWAKARAWLYRQLYEEATPA